MMNAITTEMTDLDVARVEVFLRRWEKAGGKERANYQMFFAEMCDALGVDRPNPQGGAIAYGFDHSMTFYTPSGKKTSGFVDFYKENHFVIEAKQGSEKSGSGTAKRGTQSYLKAMEGAFVQAVSYARNVSSRPPFVLTCDIGSHFELWLEFGGDYGGYGARREIGLTELVKPEIFGLFVDIFTNPQARNPEKIAAIVTREVAADLADLARSLEVGNEAQEVAQFLMRCIFTMFAEDVGLLKEQLFTETLSDRWLKNPGEFRSGAEDLWAAMNEGSKFGFYGRLLRFNGGLFANPRAFDLTRVQLEVLLRAARKDWRNVEPAIFGTLLERALDSRERSKLGAHYTPRSYVERLVRPVVMEPLRDRWEIVQAEVSLVLGNEPTSKQVRDAKALLEGFLLELRSVRVLDPACGSGNFLYVTLDLIKQLETEVFRRLADVVGADQLRLDIEQVGPAQFLGIELNPRAAAIADLVIWIGYLQWHFRRFGEVPPIEPVLREYKNIECRDAVLVWDDRVPDVDKAGKVRTRWGGREIISPVTGENIPDATNQVTIWKYINPRQAKWPETDYIVSNPPFIGKINMRESLGDGYVEALRKSYKNQVPESADLVMYWWYISAKITSKEIGKRFGFITTNSITQIFNRRIISDFLESSNPIYLFYAIPDHPWIDYTDCADVRIAMSACVAGKGEGLLEIVVNEENEEEENYTQVTLKASRGLIQSDLTIGAGVSTVIPLKANSGLAGIGVMLGNNGFIIENSSKFTSEEQYIKPLTSGSDLVKRSRGIRVIDFYGLTAQEAQNNAPNAFQQLLTKVKPERDLNNRKTRRENWWLFSETMPKTRDSIKNLRRYIPISLTAKYRTFSFLDSKVIPDVSVVAIALEDAYFLGVLSSKIHVTWALAAGGKLGVGNDPRYNKTVCFDPFPFPDPTEPKKQKIRELGDRLDAHRKRVQAANPEVTITAMYNLLEKLRKAEPLDDKDKAFNQKALVSTLKQIHDELDTAVFDAYGWNDLLGVENVEEMILERLVKLNADRAEEERNGKVRWLRPDYQAPHETQTQQTLPGMEPAIETIPIPTEQQKFPKAFKDQLAAVRDLLRTQGNEWTVPAIAAQFKGTAKQKATIPDCLESLETLGIIARHTENGTDRYYLAELQKAG